MRPRVSRANRRFSGKTCRWAALALAVTAHLGSLPVGAHPAEVPYSQPPPPPVGPGSYGPGAQAPWLGPGAPAAEATRPTPPETDPLLPTGVSLAVLGALGLIGGAVAYEAGATAGGELCGYSGCVGRPVPGVHLAGVGLMTGGGTLLAMSIPVMAVGATGEPALRDNDAMASAGVVITSLGASGIASSLAMLAAQSQSVQARHNSTDMSEGDMPLLLSGIAFLGLGIPLWAAGASDWQPPEREGTGGPVWPGDRPAERSPAMKYVGIALTTIAIEGIAVGVAGLIAAREAPCEECDNHGLSETIGAAGAFAGAGLFAAVGIPLWAVGASDAPQSNEARAEAAPSEEQASSVPDVRLGLGSIELAGRF